MSPYRSRSPQTVEEAVQLLEDVPDLFLAAGCTDLLVGDPEVRFKRTHVLNLLSIQEMRQVTETTSTLRIGAAVTFDEIRRSVVARRTAPILAEAAGLIGGWQIQNRATLGGNIVNASPAGDSLPVLLALGARFELAGADGRREVSADEFFVDYRRTALRPREILTAILISREVEGCAQRFRKVGTRAAQAISKVVVAAAAARRDGGLLRDVRLAAGSVAARPLRLRAAERAALESAGAAGAAAATEVTPIDDVRSTAEYRRWVLQNVVTQMIEEMRAP